MSNKNKVEDIEFSGGYNLLMLKAEEGNVEEVRRIITELRHIDVNTSNKKGYTALALAVKAGHVDVVKLLIATGANPDIKNNSGQSPLFLACWNNHEQIARILLDSGVEINAIDHRGWTPLMISAYHGHREISRELLARNADASIADLFGKRAIDRAKDPEIIKILQGMETRAKMFSPPLSDKNNLQSTSIMSAPVEQKSQRSNPPSILKKSNSRVSVGVVKLESDKSILSPQTPQGSGPSIQKSASASTGYRKTVEARRPLNQQKSTPVNRKDVNSAEKGDRFKPVLSQEGPSSVKSPPSRRISGSPRSLLEKKVFKDDVEKLLGDQINKMCQKVQQLVEYKVALEVPTQMQAYESQFKKQVESLLRFKAGDIFRNLQSIFNMKLKFCLSRLGYDTGDSGLNKVFEVETTFNPETISLSQEPMRVYNEKEYKVIESDISRIEKSILSHKVSQASMHSSAHTSQANRSDMKNNELVEHVNREVGSVAEYLVDYSNKKVVETAKEKSTMLYKKIIAEVTDNMEALENELKRKFEDVINYKMNKIVEILGNSSGQAKPTIEEFGSTDRNMIANQKTYSSGVYSEGAKSRTKIDQENGGSEEKPLVDFGQSSIYFEKRSVETKTKSSQQENLQTKERIQRIKNSLNFMDDEGRPEKLTQNRANGSENRTDTFDEEEEADKMPEPEKLEDDNYEEMERIYNPSYRSSMKTNAPQPSVNNRESWNQPTNKNFSVGSKPGKAGYQGPVKGDKNKTNQIPGHRAVFNNDPKAEQELMNYYDFSNE